MRESRLFCLTSTFSSLWSGCKNNFKPRFCVCSFKLNLVFRSGFIIAAKAYRRNIPIWAFLLCLILVMQLKMACWKLTTSLIHLFQCPCCFNMHVEYIKREDEASNIKCSQSEESGSPVIKGKINLRLNLRFWKYPRIIAIFVLIVTIVSVPTII